MDYVPININDEEMDFDIFDIGMELNEFNEMFKENVELDFLFDNVESKVKCEEVPKKFKKRKVIKKEKDFNIQYNNQKYKKKKSVMKCPNKGCNKTFYNGHALGGHLKYCNKKIN